jgi:hypothetical protein
VESHLNLFAAKKSEKLPERFWKNHVTATLAETIRWWIRGGMQESPEEITQYFLTVV